MTTLLQHALGADWARLPPALRLHYSPGASRDVGHMDIEYPRGMQPVLWLLARLGALVSRRGQAVSTTVEKSVVGARMHWHRTLRYADGRVQRFHVVGFRDDRMAQCTGQITAFWCLFDEKHDFAHVSISG